MVVVPQSGLLSKKATGPPNPGGVIYQQRLRAATGVLGKYQVFSFLFSTFET